MYQSDEKTLAENIFMYLLYNQDRFKIELSAYLKQMEELMIAEDRVHRPEIRDQFETIARQHIMDDVTKQLAIPTESAIIVLENLNIREYLAYVFVMH